MLVYFVTGVRTNCQAGLISQNHRSLEDVAVVFKKFTSSMLERGMAAERLIAFDAAV